MMPSRKYTWSFISYDPDTLEKLGDSCVKCACSPLHDKDVYTQKDITKMAKRYAGKPDPEGGFPKVGDRKKPHYHVIVTFSNAKSMEAARDYIISEIGIDISYVEPVADIGAYVRYFCHLDSTTKAHYSIEDCHAFGGFDLSPLDGCKEAARCRVYCEVLDAIDANSLYMYKDLLRWAASVYQTDGDNLSAQVLDSVIRNGASWVAVMRDRRAERAEGGLSLVDSYQAMDDAADKLISGFMA